MQVCTKCIAQFGFRFSDKSKTFETDEELYEHMENVHGMVVMREGETEEQAEERCTKKGIIANRAICQCEECKILRSQLPLWKPGELTTEERHQFERAALMERQMKEKSFILP